MRVYCYKRLTINTMWFLSKKISKIILFILNWGIILRLRLFAKIKINIGDYKYAKKIKFW